MKLGILSRNLTCYSTRRLREAAKQRGHNVKVLDTLKFAIDLEQGEPDLYFRRKQLSDYDADVLVNQGREVVSYFREVAGECGDAKKASNWIQQDVLRTLNDNDIRIDQFGVSAHELANLIKAVSEGQLDNSRAKDVFAKMLEENVTAAEAMKQLGIEKIDDSAIVDLCRELLAANPKIVADVQGGKQQAVGALIGQAKKKNPNANPGKVRETCLQLIAEMGE